MARLSTLWHGTAYQEGGRMFLATSAWPMVRLFPVWGTGYGTFRYIEPLYLHTPQDVGWAYEYAHNEYLKVGSRRGWYGSA